MLHPGQAYLNGKVITTNLDQDIAWKNGAFYFEGMDIQSVLRQISRWYNVDIQFEGEIPSKKIGGRMGRDLNLSQVLIALRDVGINTRIDGNHLIILSNN